MLDYNWLHAAETYLKNLHLMKLVHDEGIDISVFHHLELTNYDYTFDYVDTELGIFLSVSEHIFELVEHYSCDEENMDDKQYWLKEATGDSDIHEFVEIIVIMDEKLKNPLVGPAGKSLYAHGFIEVFKINEGVILVYDINDGLFDFSDVMAKLLASRK